MALQAQTMISRNDARRFVLPVCEWSQPTNQYAFVKRGLGGQM